MIRQYQKKLSELLVSLSIALDESVADPEIMDIQIDSRQLVAGTLFVALKGLQVDARDYVSAVTKSDAAALIYEANELSDIQAEAIKSLDVPTIDVENLSEKLGHLAASFYDYPSQDISVFGVTGTNGKTSCAYFLTQCLSGLGYKTGFMGTIGYGDIANLKTSTHTTLDAISLQRSLAEMRDAEFTHVCMEVSSHALDQSRVAGTEFYGVMLTNLSHEHLDYHGDMQNYAAAKRRLFTQFESKFAVVNQEHIAKIIDKEVIRAEYVVSYGIGGDVAADDIEAKLAGLSLYIDSDSVDFELNTQIIGNINVPNILLVATTLLVLGVEIEDIQTQIAQVHAPDGRMELFSTANSKDNNSNPSVVVDYAHTPDALKNALTSLREHCSGFLWCVFGCGGDRDKEKRLVMGDIAANYADKIVITNDNPRSEKPSEIIGQILQGVTRDEAVTVIENRENAVQWAISQAQPNDWILVAGKGHEDYQIIGDQTLPYSDRIWVAECLEAAA